MRWLAVVGLLVPVILAGCLGQEDSATAPEAPVDPRGPPAPIDLVNALTGCTETLATFMVLPAQAQKFLPPGFQTRDAGGFFGIPVASGKAAVLLSTRKCDNSQYEGGSSLSARLYVYVDPPNVPGTTLDPVDLDFYDVAYLTESPRLLELLRSINFTADGAFITATVTPYAPGNLGLGRVADEQGELFRFEMATTRLNDDATKTRDWHVVPAGLAYFEARPKSGELDSGSLTSCTMRPDSLAHKLVGATDCSNQQTVGVIFPKRDIAEAFHFLPGVVAGS